MSDEFEDRENELNQDTNSLGNLPQDVAKEHGTEIDPVAPQIPPYSGMVDTDPASLPPDIRGNFKTLAVDGESVLGSPTIPASVTSVWDARPINARDWKIIAYPTLNIAAPELLAQLDVDFTVPEGFVGVLKRFRWQPVRALYLSNDIVTGGGANPYLDYLPKCSILINNVVIRDYDQLQFGVTMTDEQDVFALASPGQKFTLRVNIPNIFTNLYTTDGAMTGNLHYRLEMYGQLLLTRGLPLPFEISTQNKSGDL